MGALCTALLVPASSEALSVSVKEENFRGFSTAASFTTAVVSYPVLLGGGREEGKGSSVKVRKQCPSKLVVLLKDAGFRGRNLREAWAIAMRESRGHAKSVSSTQDYGVFQFNKATWQEADWWDRERLLQARYNIRVAYRLSDGGRTWYLWGLDGRGRPNAHLYRGAGWSDKQVQEYIVEPYQKYYREYRKLPSECR